MHQNRHQNEEAAGSSCWKRQDLISREWRYNSNHKIMKVFADAILKDFFFFKSENTVTATGLGHDFIFMSLKFSSFG